MKVYLVMNGVEYEGSSIVSVHLHEHTAQARADELGAKNKNPYEWYEVREEEVEQ